MMCNGTTTSCRGCACVSRSATALSAMLLAATLCGLAGTRPAVAQATYYADLNAAVAGLASRLTENDRLGSEQVLVNAHDFFEEGTGRNLPLSKSLRERFGTELATRGVPVFVLPEGSEDDMVIFQGIWRVLPEPGVRPGTRKIHLTVKLIERTEHGQRLRSSANGQVDGIDENDLKPDRESWGRHVVKELERLVRDRRDRAIHAGDYRVWGDVAKPEFVREYLEAFWVEPAFAESRRFRLVAASTGDRRSDGVLHVIVHVSREHVGIRLKIQDNEGVQLAAVGVEMAKGLFPPGIFDAEAKDDETTQDPEPEPTAEVASDVAQSIEECEAHVKGERWSEAWGCYGKVLERDAGNETAESGRSKIERVYKERVLVALARWDFAGATGIVEEFGRMAPDSARVREWEKEMAGAKVFRDCEECPEMVVVPSGSYEMGSPDWEVGRSEREGPLHRVTISDALAVGVYEVTFAEWEACVSEGGCYGYRPEDEGWGRGRRPVINMSWEDARAYVGWLSRKTGRGYRLLSESEWEYAARAGATAPFHYGGTISTEQANYDGRYVYGTGRKGEYRGRTMLVGSFPANEFGLHDVHGNVWEWVEDCWHGDYKRAPGDGRAWTSGGECSARVLRGGSWNNLPRDLRSVFRGRGPTAYRDDDYGFRVARTLTP